MGRARKEWPTSLYDFLIKERRGEVAFINSAVTRDGAEIAISSEGYEHFISRSKLEDALRLIENTLDFYDRHCLSDDDIKSINSSLLEEEFNRPIEKKPKKVKKVFIYVVRDASSSTIKVGKSARPESRLTNLQVSNSHRLELIYTHDGYDSDEKALHKKLSNACLHVQGEWFKDCPEALEIVRNHFIDE